MSKHTPGPWTFDGPADNIIVWSSPENRVCFMTSDGAAEANARLIAAAPDMLDSLRDCLDRIVEAFPDLKNYGPIKRGYEAIAKAEGRP